MLAGITRGISFAEFELDPVRRRLLRGGEPLAINAKTYDLLIFLVENNGRVVSKDEILESVWVGQFVEEANLPVQVSALRKVLGDKKDAPRFLITVPGKGYKFVADVVKPDDTLIIEEQTIERIIIDDEIEAVANGGRAKLAAVPELNRNRGLIFVGSLALIAMLAFGLYNYYPPAPTSEIRSLAVLPFINEDRSPDTEYLDDGLAESVIHSLSRFPELRVMSRNSSFRHRGIDVDAKRVGADLNVQAVLTGRLAHAGNNVTVSAELISTVDNSVIWGGQFTREISELERLRSDISGAVARRLQLRNLGDGADRSASDPEVYRLYLMGRYHIGKMTDAGFYKGREYFQQAVAMDAAYAPAYAGLAEAYNRLSTFHAVKPAEGFEKARSAALRAIELDEQSAEAHAALGTVKHAYDWDWAGAEREFKRAVEINPNNADARMQYGYHLMSMVRFDEALSEMKTAAELDPLSLEKMAGVGEVHYVRRNFDKAAEQFRRVIEMDPNSGFGHWALGNAYLQKGMYDEAIREYRVSIPLSGDSPDESATLACAFALSGNEPEARRMIEELKQKSLQSHVPPSLFAIIYTALGDRELAFEWLEKGYAGKDFLLSVLNIEPLFEKLHGDPRFDDLLKRVGLPQMQPSRR